MKFWDHVMDMFRATFNGITVYLGQLLFGSTLHPIKWCLVVQ